MYVSVFMARPTSAGALLFVPTVQFASFMSPWFGSRQIFNAQRHLDEEICMPVYTIYDVSNTTQIAIMIANVGIYVIS
jgi:hypothetical protein